MYALAQKNSYKRNVNERNFSQRFSNGAIQMLFFNEHCHSNSICFKSFLQLFFIYRRDGPSENLWGWGAAGRSTKKTYSRNRKLNEKKNHTRQLTLKKYLWYGLKKNHTRNLITEKNSCGSKILHPPLSNGPSLSDGEVDLGGHSFSPPLTP